MKNIIETTKSRRNFLKKAAYVAPTIVGLGGLTLPVSAGASIFSANIYYNNNSLVPDAVAFISGNSATGVLDNPAGGYIRYSTINSEGTATTIENIDIDIKQVEINSEGYFNFATDWFSSIDYNTHKNSTIEGLEGYITR